jgi:hypothetical protein
MRPDYCDTPAADRYGQGTYYFEGEGEGKPLHLLLHGTQGGERVCLERRLRPGAPMPAGWEEQVAVQLRLIEQMDAAEVAQELQLLRDADVEWLGGASEGEEEAEAEVWDE